MSNEAQFIRHDLRDFRIWRKEGSDVEVRLTVPHSFKAQTIERSAITIRGLDAMAMDEAEVVAKVLLVAAAEGREAEAVWKEKR